MLGQSGVGTYVAYVMIGGFLLLIILLFLRVVLMMSLLWLMPVIAVLRKVPGLRRLLPADDVLS